MNKEKEALNFVYSQVSKDVGQMYEHYRKRCGLKEETDTEKQLDILVNKKYISGSYIIDLIVLADYYQRGLHAQYSAGLLNYKTRIHFLLESH